MSSNLLKGVLHTGFTKVLIFAASLVSTFILVHSLPLEQYGVWGLLNGANWLMGPFLGMMLSAYVGREAPGRDSKQAHAILKVTLTTEMLIAVAVLLLLVASGAIHWLTRMAHAEPYYGVFLLGVVLMVSFSLYAETLNFAYSGLHIATGNYMEVVAQAGWVLPIAVIWLAHGPLTLSIVLWMAIAASLASSLLGSRLIDWKAFSAAPYDRALLRRALAYSVPLVLPSLNFGALRFVDRFVLSSYRGLASVAVYSFAGTIVSVCFNFSYRILNTALSPHVTAAHNREDLARRNLLLSYFLKLSISIFLILVVAFFAVGRFLIRWFARPEYNASLPYVALLALTYVLLTLSMPGQLMLQLQNRTRTILVIELVAVMLTVGLDFALIPRYGVAGAIAAGWVGWGFLAAAKTIASRLWSALVWNELWSLDREFRSGKEFLMRWRFGADQSPTG